MINVAMLSWMLLVIQLHANAYALIFFYILYCPKPFGFIFFYFFVSVLFFFILFAINLHYIFHKDFNFYFIRSVQVFRFSLFCHKQVFW